MPTVGIMIATIVFFVLKMGISCLKPIPILCLSDDFRRYVVPSSPFGSQVVAQIHLAAIVVQEVIRIEVVA